jgi:hypothetical protein
MVLGASTAMIWQVWLKLGLPLPAVLQGVHGFVTGTAVGLIVIVIGTLVGKPAPKEFIEKSWGTDKLPE